MEGWTDGRTHARIQDYLLWRGVGGGGGGPGLMARIQVPQMGPIHTGVYTYKRMYRQAHECSCTGRRIDIRHVHV